MDAVKCVRQNVDVIKCHAEQCMDCDQMCQNVGVIKSSVEQCMDVIKCVRQNVGVINCQREYGCDKPSF